jgi:hypothetical protein
MVSCPGESFISRCPDDAPLPSPRIPKEPYVSSRLAAIICLAFIFRLLQVVLNGDWLEPLNGQPTEEVQIAQHVAEGQGFATPFGAETSSGRSPSAVSDDRRLPYRIALVLGALSGSIAVGILALAGERAAGLAGFWVVGLLAAIWPPLVSQSGVLWDTPFTLLAMTLGVLLATGSPRWAGPPAGFHVILGGFCGLATLFNPIVAPFLAVATATRLAAEGRRLQPWLIVGGVWLFCVTPWLVRNALVFHRLIPIRANMGLELWIGNLPGTDGTSEGAWHRHPVEDPIEQQLVEQLGEGDYMRMKEGQALALIRAAPRRFLQKTGRRILLYWFGNFGRPTNLFGLTFPLLLGINLLKVAINGLLIGLALGGLLDWQPLQGRWALALGLLILPVPYYLTHVATTYRTLVDPLLCLLAGVFLVQSVSRVFWTISSPVNRSEAVNAA